MAIKIDSKNLEFFRKLFENTKIGFTCSCWDLLHAGHNLFLKDCKENSQILIVGLQTDPTIDRPEKNKPVQSFAEREIQVQSCRWIDYYFVYETEFELLESIKKLSPNVRFLGDDYVGKKFTGSDLDIEIYYHKRSENNFSTTNLRKNIYEKEKNKIKL